MVTGSQALSASLELRRMHMRPLEPHPSHKRRWLTLVVCVLLVMLITVRFFTERVVILPRFLNPVDLVIVPILLPIYLIWRSSQTSATIKERKVFALSGLVAASWGLSWIININGAHWLGAVLLITGLLTPIVFYLILVNFGFEYKSASTILNLLLVLFVINLVIASFDVMIGIEEEAGDFVFGTFGVNQNQLAFFLASMACYYLASWLFERKANWKIVAFAWGMVLFLLCGFQTMWVILPIAAGFVFVKYGKLSKRLFLAISISSLVPVLVLTFLTFAHFRVFYVLMSSFEEFDQLGKVELVENVGLIWYEHPAAILIGVGPGSFNSRAFRSIAIVPSGAKEGTDVAAAIVDPFYRSVLSDQYIIPYFIRGRFLLSGTNTDGPFTSYVSVPVEIGLLGAVGVFGIYAVVALSLIESLKKTKSARLRVLASWALINLLMLLGIAMVDNYLETTRYTILVWLSVAIWKISQQRLDGLEGPIKRESV